jgi:1-acyl-sn-glycerol-3-phosphate acyltransferase
LSVNAFYNPVMYWLGKHISGTMFNLLWRRRIYGLENIPPHGSPVIFAANHRSLADPNLIGSAVPYPINYFAKDELFQIPVLGWCIRRVNAFPVNRLSADVGAIRMAQKVLEGGEGLVLFPEGGRRRDPKRQWQVKSGVGLLACTTGALVVPVGIKNSENFTHLGKIEVHFGKPLVPPKDASRENYETFSQQVMDQIRQLATGGKS